MNFLTGFVKSFNPKAYKEIAFQPLSLSFKYLLFLFLILALILSSYFSAKFFIFGKKMSENFKNFFTQMKDVPEIIIENGKIVFPNEKIEKELNGIIFIIDKNGNLDEYINALNKSSKFTFVFVGNKFLIKSGEQQPVNIYNLTNNLELKFGRGTNFLEIKSNEKKFNFSKEFINSSLKYLIIIIFLVSFIVIFIGFWIVKLFQVFLFSLFSMIINRTQNLKLKYSSLINIGIFALTPVIIFEIISELLNLPSIFIGITYFCIYFIYLFLGILKSKI